jgi:hypothetical protein
MLFTYRYSRARKGMSLRSIFLKRRLVDLASNATEPSSESARLNMMGSSFMIERLLLLSVMTVDFVDFVEL